MFVGLIVFGAVLAALSLFAILLVCVIVYGDRGSSPPPTPRGHKTRTLSTATVQTSREAASVTSTDAETTHDTFQSFPPRRHEFEVHSDDFDGDGDGDENDTAVDGQTSLAFGRLDAGNLQLYRSHTESERVLPSHDTFSERPTWDVSRATRVGPVPVESDQGDDGSVHSHTDSEVLDAASVSSSSAGVMIFDDEEDEIAISLPMRQRLNRHAPLDSSNAMSISLPWHSSMSQHHPQRQPTLAPPSCQAEAAWMEFQHCSTDLTTDEHGSAADIMDAWKRPRTEYERQWKVVLPPIVPGRIEV